MEEPDHADVRAAKGRLVLILGALPSAFLGSVLLVCGLLSFARGLNPISGIDLGSAFGMLLAVTMLPAGFLVLTLLALSRVNKRVLALTGAGGYLLLACLGLIVMLLSDPGNRPSLALPSGLFSSIFLIASISSFAGWWLRGLVSRSWVIISSLTGIVVVTGILLAALAAPLQLEAARRVLEGHTASVRDVAWSPDGAYLASASWDGTVIIWDPATGEAVNRLVHDGTMVSNVAWSPDGSMIASSFDETAVVWEVETGERIMNIADNPQFVQDLAWSPDSAHLASSYPIIVRDVETGKQINASTDQRLNSIGNSILWSPDGTILVYEVGSRQVVQWDPKMDERTGVLTDFANSDVSTSAWSPDGRYLAAGSQDGSVTVWDLTNDRRLLTLEEHEYTVDSLSWSPDGTLLASASFDTIILWEMPDGTLRRRFASQSGHVWSVAWSPDGTLLASAGQDGHVLLWFR